MPIFLDYLGVAQTESIHLKKGASCREPFPSSAKGLHPMNKVFVTPELLKVLRWDFCSENRISLEIYLGLSHVPPRLLRMRK